MHQEPHGVVDDLVARRTTARRGHRTANRADKNGADDGGIVFGIGPATTNGRFQPAGPIRGPLLRQVGRVSGIYLNYSLGSWSDWYSNREFRDNRTAIFMNYFDGDATQQYAMRVEVPGEFKIAPARVELMYQPTVQANTSNDRLRILDKK